jgi:hypothetical protein
MIGTALRYLWALPATIVGLAVAMIAVGQCVDGAIEVGGGRVGRAIARLPPSIRFHAITLGHVIVGTGQRALESSRAHERVHVRQYERWGMLFFALYVGSSLAQWLCGRHPYFDNCFEREAYACAAAEGTGER